MVITFKTKPGSAGFGMDRWHPITTPSNMQAASGHRYVSTRFLRYLLTQVPKVSRIIWVIFDCVVTRSVPNEHVCNNFCPGIRTGPFPSLASPFPECHLHREKS